MPKNSLKNPAKNFGLLTTTIFICTSLSAMPSALKQPYTQPDKANRKHHQHQLSRQKAKTQHSCAKKNKGKPSSFVTVSASHTPHHLYCILFDIAVLVRVQKQKPRGFYPDGFQ